MRCRTVYRATCSSIYVIWALQLTSIFLDIDRIFFVDTCCVWGGFGRFQTYLGATTRCPLFAGTGGVFTQWHTPPCSFYFALFLCLFYPTANVPDTLTGNQSQTSTFPVLLSQASKERSDVAIA